VFVADDGSGQETRNVFEEWSEKQEFQVRHVWQEHHGFRRSRVLNEAIARATGDYIVFLDGDTIPHPQFIADHVKLAAPGYFVQGHRALVERPAVVFFGLRGLMEDRSRALWSFQLTGLKHAYRWPFPWKRLRLDLKGIRGCNLGIWREDLIAVNGYDEAFVGWGREDSDLALRLMNSSIVRRDVRGWCICFHLWHPPASRGNLPSNDKLLEAAIQAKSRRCKLGISDHL
jgi:glycosyltransferase involved in cell wall biosynthesis